MERRFEVAKYKYHGQGTFKFIINGRVGNSNMNHDGQGVYTFNTGEQYTGEFKNGVSHGQGTTTFQNGDKFVENIKMIRNGQELTTFLMEKNSKVNLKIISIYQGTFYFLNEMFIAI